MVSASHWPTGPPRFVFASGAKEKSDSARKIAMAPPVIASASRRIWPGAGADRPFVAMRPPSGPGAHGRCEPWCAPGGKPGGRRLRSPIIARGGAPRASRPSGPRLVDANATAAAQPRMGRQLRYRDHPPHPNLSDPVRSDPVREGASVLHLENEGEDHGAAVQALEISTEGLADLFLHLGPVGAQLGADGGQRLEDFRPRALHDLGARLLGDDAAGDEIRAGDDVARMLGDGENRQHESALGEMASITEHNALDLTDTLAVDEDTPRGDPAGAPRPDVGELQHV